MANGHSDIFEQVIENRKLDRFPYTKLDANQQAIVDGHLQATTRSSRNCESLRDPLELKYIQEVATKMYAGLDLPTPAIHILDSPMSCAFVWAHTPKSVAERWRIFNDDFYTHPLSATLVDVIQDGYKAFQRLVDHTIDISLLPAVRSPIQQAYTDLERVGDLVSTTITGVKTPMSDVGLAEMAVKQIETLPEQFRNVLRQPIPNLEGFQLPGDIFRGQHYVTTAYYQAMSDLGLPFVGYHKNMIHLWQQMNKACHWWFPYKNVLILSDRPATLQVDDRGRPHNAKGPAIEYRDGWKIYAWKGILIPSEIVEKPQDLSVSKILNEGNTEIRRVMVDVYGLDRFVIDAKGKSLDKQGEYELLEVPYLDGLNMRALKMRCPTTLAVYVHTVHPDCTNVEQALAWKRGEDNFQNARPYKEGLLWEK